jgi:DivIVA domain-containing protein
MPFPGRRRGTTEAPSWCPSSTLVAPAREPPWLIDRDPAGPFETPMVRHEDSWTSRLAAPPSAPTIGHTRDAVVEGESAQNDQPRTGSSARAPGRAGSFSERELRVHVPAEVRDVSFPHAVRGYDRAAVDAYVRRVNHLIAELEMSRSPRTAVRHALDRATEEVSGILQRAQETADEITSSARREAEEGATRIGAQAAQVLVNASDAADRTRAEADELLTKARAEAEKTLATAKAEAEKALATARAGAEEILTRSRTEGGERLQRSEKEIAVRRELAETRMRDLQADTEAVWKERRELLDHMRGMAARLTEMASEAAARFPPRKPGESEEEMPEPEAVEAEPSAVAATDATRALSEVGLGEERGGEASEEEARSSGS